MNLSINPRVSEVAAYLGMSTSAMYNAIRQNGISDFSPRQMAIALIEHYAAKYPEKGYNIPPLLIVPTLDDRDVNPKKDDDSESFFAEFGDKYQMHLYKNILFHVKPELYGIAYDLKRYIAHLVIDNNLSFDHRVWNKFIDSVYRVPAGVQLFKVCKGTKPNSRFFSAYDNVHFANDGQLKLHYRDEFKLWLIRAIKQLNNGVINFRLVEPSESLESFPALKNWLSENSYSAAMPILQTASNTGTIAGREVNGFARYFHDICHLKIDKGFNLEGETKATEKMVEVLQDIGAPKIYQDIINADYGYQYLYYHNHKRFIIDGVRFIHESMLNPSYTISNFKDIK